MVHVSLFNVHVDGEGGISVIFFSFLCKAENTGALPCFFLS